jgi:hypothetical protein
MINKSRHVHGERSCHAKLTDKDVIEIRRSYAAKEFSLRTLGLKYGISNVTVFDIIKRKYWKHLAG